MSVKEDKVNLVITINGDQGRKELGLLDTESRKLRESMKGMKKDSDEYVAASAKLKEVTTRMGELRTSIGLSSKNVKELQDELRQLMMARRYIQPGTDAFADNSAKIREVKTRMGELNAEVKVGGGFWASMGNQIKAAGVIAATYFGLSTLVSQFSNIITKNAQLTDSLADLRRVAGLSQQEVEDLNKRFGKFDTRSATQQLREIAVIAGKLGIEGVDNIAGFTREVDKLVVSLGDELGGADQITTQLGKILNVFDGKITAQNISELGNAFVVLANKGVATGGFLADFAQRVAPISKLANLSLGSVLGFGAGMEELGLRAESGSTAFQKIISEMGNAEKAAKIAGISVKEFNEMVADKPQEAILKYSEGLVKNKAAWSDITASFKNAGEDGQRVITTIATIGDKADFFRTKIELGTEALKNTIAINAAFALKNETLGAELDKLGKKFYAFISSPGLTAFLTDQVRNVSSLITALTKLPQFIKENSVTLITLTGVTLAYYASVLKATAGSIGLTTAKIAGNAVDTIQYYWLVTTTKAKAAYALMTDVVTGKVTIAAAAQRIWNAVLAANPLGIFIIALTALVAGIELYRKNTSEAIALEKQKHDLSKKLVDVNAELQKSYEQNNTALETFNRLSPIERQNLVESIAKKKEDAIATYRQLQAQQALIMEKSKEATVWQKAANVILGLGNPAQIAYLNQKDAMANASEAAGAYSEQMLEVNKSIEQLGGQLTNVNKIQNAESDAMAINAITAGQLEEKLNLLQTALKNVAPAGKDATRIRIEIEEVRKKINAGDSTTGLSDGDKAKMLSAEESFAQKLIELTNKTAAARAKAVEDEEQREIASLKAKYEAEQLLADENLKKANADKKLTPGQKEIFNTATLEYKKEATAKYENEISQITEKFQTKRNDDEYAQSSAHLQDWYSHEQTELSKQLASNQITKQQYDDRGKKLEGDYLAYKLSLARDYGKSVEQIEKDIADGKIKINEDEFRKHVQMEANRLPVQYKMAEEGSQARTDAEIAILKKAGEDKKAQLTSDADAQLAGYTSLSDAKIQIDAETNQSIEDANAEHNAKMIQMAQQAFSQVSSIIDSALQLEINADNAELASNKRTNNEKKKNLDKQLKAGLISKEDHDARVAEMDEEFAKKKHELELKEFKHKQEGDMIRAVINTALGVTAALTMPPPASYIMAALTLAAGLAEVAVISSQSPPEYAQGGRMLGGSVMPGDNSTTKDNLAVIDPATGNQVASIKSGEPVLSQSTYENNKPLIDSLLNKSMNENGGRLAEDGEVIDPLTGNVFKPARNLLNHSEADPLDARNLLNHSKSDSTFDNGGLMNIKGARNLLNHSTNRPARNLLNHSEADPVDARNLLNHSQSAFARGGKMVDPDARNLLNHSISHFDVGGILPNLQMPVQPDVDQLRKQIQVAQFGPIVMQGQQQPQPADQAQLMMLVKELIAETKAHKQISSALLDSSDEHLGATQQLANDLPNLQVTGVWDWEHYQRSTKQIADSASGAKIG